MMTGTAQAIILRKVRKNTLIHPTLTHLIYTFPGDLQVKSTVEAPSIQLHSMSSVRV